MQEPMIGRVEDEISSCDLSDEALEAAGAMTARDAVSRWYTVVGPVTAWALGCCQN